MRTLTIAILASLLTACGGGGGDQSTPATGTITVAITDNEINDWDEALMVVNAITLIGAGGQETDVLDTPQTIDFLKLRNVSELLLHRSLTARSISKIRLEIDSIELRKVDANGNPVETAWPPVPSRKLDLNPQGPIQIRAGEDVLVMLDVDLANSIKAHRNGNGQLRFRPVVHLTVGPSGLVRLYGTYTVNGDASICELERVSDADGVFEVLDMCVVLDETNANYFGSDGLPLGDALADGEKISAYGYYEQTATGDVLAAVIIARGTGMRGEAFRTLNGVAASDYNDTDRAYVLALTNPEQIPVKLSDGAKVFNLDGEIQPDPAAVILGGVRTEARGALTDLGDDSVDDWLQSFFVVVGGDATSDSTSGEIAMDGVQGDMITLTNVAPDMLSCVITHASTDFLRTEMDGDVTNISKISLDDLMDGDTIDATGDRIGECIQADTVIQEETS